MRNFFLACSRSQWLRKQAPRYGFVRRAVQRFMPGETVDEALEAAAALQKLSINTVFTYLGENIADPTEAQRVTEHYLDVLARIEVYHLRTEVSVKLTQLGLDLNPETCYANLCRVIERAGPGSLVWVDMEASSYVDATLGLYRRARQAYPNVGVCLQAYLYRTLKDLEDLLPLGPAIRLVKGAYQEPPEVAFPKKSDVDENYFKLAQRLLDNEARAAHVRAAMATHDVRMIERIIRHAESLGLGKGSVEFQMLYGIQRAEQIRLAREGWSSIVLIAYGSYWFPWYMRRLAERPANAGFVLRSLFSG
ncbi:MAG TPA: proline dehydrogenase family protein [Terriglobia bacterium]|nr:proline dehydrogenase family protein [Terriglobia bacterium]